MEVVPNYGNLHVRLQCRHAILGNPQVSNVKNVVIGYVNAPMYFIQADCSFKVSEIGLRCLRIVTVVFAFLPTLYPIVNDYTHTISTKSMTVLAHVKLSMTTLIPCQYCIVYRQWLREQAIFKQCQIKVCFFTLIVSFLFSSKIIYWGVCVVSNYCVRLQSTTAWTHVFANIFA